MSDEEFLNRIAVQEQVRAEEHSILADALTSDKQAAMHHRAAAIRLRTLAERHRRQAKELMREHGSFTQD